MAASEGISFPCLGISAGDSTSGWLPYKAERINGEGRIATAAVLCDPKDNGPGHLEHPL